MYGSTLMFICLRFCYHRKDFQMAIDTCTHVFNTKTHRKILTLMSILWFCGIFFEQRPLIFDPTDTFFWNGSLCCLRLGQAEHSLYDAQVCRELKPDWFKGCFREGVALRLLQVKTISILLQKSDVFEHWNIIIHWVINESPEIWWGSQCFFTRE